MNRFLTIAGAVLAGLAGSLILASPASAHSVNVATTNRCLPDGTREITWTVLNSEADTLADVTKVILQPAGSTVTSVVVGAAVPKAGTVVGTQILPGDATTAHLEVWATWTLPDGTKKENSAEHTAVWDGTCTVGDTVVSTCTTMTFTFPALPELRDSPPTEVSLTPSVDEPQTFTRKNGDPEKTVTFAGTPGLTVAFSYGSEFSKTYAWTPAGCPDPNLAKTGNGLYHPVAIGGGLLIAGVLVVGLLLFRRSRRPTAGA